MLKTPLVIFAVFCFFKHLDHFSVLTLTQEQPSHLLAEGRISFLQLFFVARWKQIGFMALTKGGREAKWFEREKQNNLHKEMLLIKKMFWSIA